MAEHPIIMLAVDVDDTLASKIKTTHVSHYGSLLRRDRSGSGLHLDITPEDIAAAEAYPSTFAHPKIKAYREDDTGSIDPNSPQERLFQWARGLIRKSRRVHISFDSMEGSQEGLRYLTRDDGRVQLIGYHTVRPEQVGDATKEWLLMHEYPDAENVVLRKSPRDKVEQLLTTMTPREDGQLPFVALIDDGVKGLVDAIKEVQAERPDDILLKQQLRHFILMGFGPHAERFAHELYPVTDELGVQALVLPDWSHQQVKMLEQRLGQIARG